MKGQSEPGIGLIYIAFFILMLVVGGYWILHTNSWLDYNILYGQTVSLQGKVMRIERGCTDQKKTLVMLENQNSQSYIYIPLKFEVFPGDQLTLTAYNVSGRGLFFDILKSKCEPDGLHYYATKVRSERTGLTLEARPWS
jgi:hypothetical protein